jgi:hypothetical protein
VDKGETIVFPGRRKKEECTQEQVERQKDLYRKVYEDIGESMTREEVQFFREFCNERYWHHSRELNRAEKSKNYSKMANEDIACTIFFELEQMFIEAANRVWYEKK